LCFFYSIDELLFSSANGWTRLSTDDKSIWVRRQAERMAAPPKIPPGLRRSPNTNAEVAAAHNGSVLHGSGSDGGGGQGDPRE